MYYDFAEPVSKMVPHRVLATNRGEKEDILKVSLVADETKINDYFQRQLIGKQATSLAAPYIEAAYLDSYKRFIGPAIEREIRNELTEKLMNKRLQFSVKIYVIYYYSHHLKEKLF